MGARLELNIPATVDRFAPNYQKAQKWLDNEVLKDCDPYVPKRTGNLIHSGILGTKIGSGKVIYNAPYAKINYYGTNRKFSKDKNPKACAQWFEAAKAVKKKSWEKGVKKIIGE